MNEHFTVDIKKLQDFSIAVNDILIDLRVISLDEILQKVAKNAAILANAESCGILVKYNHVLRLEASYGHREGHFVKGREFTIGSGKGTGLTGHIAYTGKVFNTSGRDLVNHPAVKGVGSHTPSGVCHSLLMVPLIHDTAGGKREIKAWLRLDNKKGADGRSGPDIAFTDEDQIILEFFSNMIIAALDVASIVKELSDNKETLQALNKKLRILYNASNILLSARSIKKTLKAVVDQARIAADAVLVSIIMLNTDGTIEGLETSWDSNKWDGSNYTTRTIRQDGHTKYIIDSDKPVIIKDITQYQSEQYDHISVNPYSVKAGFKSVLGLPFRLQNKVLGAIWFHYLKPREFEPFEIDLMQIYANQAALAYDLVELLDDLRRQNQRLKTLNRFSRQISQSLNENEIYRVIARAVITTLDSTHCTIFEREGNCCIPKASAGESPDVKISHTFLLGEGLVGQVALTGIPILDNNAKLNEHFVEGLTNPDVDRSLIVVPVKRENEVIAVISADQDQINAFDGNDLQLLQTLAWQAGISLQNAHYVDQEKQYARVLKLLLQKRSDIDRILDIIMRGAMKLTHTESGIIYLVNRAQSTIIKAYEFPKDFNHPVTRFEQKKGMTWEIVKTGKEIAVTDIGTDPRVNPVLTGKGVKAILGLPLTVERETIGALFINDSEVRAFSPYEIKMLRSLADQAAIAIADARQNKMLEGLARTGNRLIGTLDNERKVLKKVVDQAKEVLECDLAVIVPYDNVENRLMVKSVVHTKIPPDVEFRMPLDETTLESGRGRITGMVLKDGWLEVEDIDDSQRYPFIQRQPDSFLVRANIRSFVGVRLQVAGVVSGILFIDYQNPRRFSQGELKVIRLLADQATVAIENARLLEQRKHDISALQDINKVIATENLSEIAGLIAQKAYELTQAGVCELWIKRGGNLELEAIFPKHETRKNAPTTLAIDEHSINGLVLSRNQPYNCGETDTDPYYQKVREDIHSNMAVPLRVDGEPIGTLSVESRKYHAFTKYQMGLLQSLADQAAIAIRNRWIFDQLERLHEISAEISSKQTDLLQVLDSIVKHLYSLFENASCAICVYDAQKDELTEKFAVGALKNMWLKPREDGTTWFVIHNKKPLILNDAENPKDKDLPLIRKELAEKGVKSIAYLPLLFRDKIIGILYLNLTVPHTFNQVDERILGMLADYAAIAIGNAQLYVQIAESESTFIRGQTAYDLVHRLNNMLGTVPARIELVRINLNKPEMLDLVNRNLEGAAEDARRVMREARKLQSVPAFEIIDDLLLMLEAIVQDALLTAECPINVRFKREEKLPDIYSIRVNISYAFQFVVDNAIEAMAEQGENLLISVLHNKREKMIEVRISDDGPQIPVEYREDIFQAGFTTKESGTGYGLWRARKLIEGVNGSLSLDDPLPGELVKTFVFKLPARKKPDKKKV